ncbi:MAG: hypothetical protein ACKO38_00490, partial [Planctomycetota bacterium]
VREQGFWRSGPPRLRNRSESGAFGLLKVAEHRDAHFLAQVVGIMNIVPKKLAQRNYAAYWQLSHSRLETRRAVMSIS